MNRENIKIQEPVFVVEDTKNKKFFILFGHKEFFLFIDKREKPVDLLITNI